MCPPRLPRGLLTSHGAPFGSGEECGAKLVVVMGKVEKIEQQVQALSSHELAQFRAWFLEFDWAAWDRQIEQDVRAGRLDVLAEQALRDHASSKTKPL